ncbi:DUF2799 domain-containing protein [Erythrobacter aureus]|uniref:DUF2799 domain-containing protein n=1 Tax=Erythrobacter aureus TaxID=2182384 RepID=UPI003A8C9E0F
MAIGKLKLACTSTLLIAGLSGCATISEKSCAYDAWYDVGFRGAMANHDRADYLDDILEDCGKHGFEPDIAELRRGFADGTERFCEPDNGFAWGRAGHGYNGICRSSEFSNAYAEGYHIYEIETRRSAIVSRLSSIRSELEKLEKTLDEDELTEKEQRKARRNYDKLRRERKDLRRELEALPFV